MATDLLELVRLRKESCGCRGPCDDCMLFSLLAAEVRNVRAENEALRADVVWGIKNLRAFMPREADALPGRIQWQSRAWQGHDGTDADILRAVREARTK